MRVVQWTVSYALGDRSLRYINANIKVTARVKIYGIKAGIIETICVTQVQ